MQITPWNSIRLGRGRFLVVATAFLGTACLGDDKSIDNSGAKTRLTRTPSVTTTPAPPPVLEISTDEAPQGGFLSLLVTAAQAGRVHASFLDVEYQLGQRVPGRFWGLVPVDGFQDPGKFKLTVNLEAGDGQLLDPLTRTISVTDAGFPTENVEIPPEKAGLLDPQIAKDEAAQLEAAYDIFTPRQRWEGKFMQPAQGTFTSPYGIRRGYNGAPVSTYHHGLDIANDAGTPIVAANNGRVVFAGQMKLRGNAVIVDHGYGIFSGYNHMQEIGVELGQDLKTGDRVGAMGTTGLSTGAHLHWEIAVRGTTINPAGWLEVAVSPPEREEPSATPTPG